MFLIINFQLNTYTVHTCKFNTKTRNTYANKNNAEYNTYNLYCNTYT